MKFEKRKKPYGVLALFGFSLLAMIATAIIISSTTTRCVKSGWPIGNCEQYGPPVWPEYLGHLAWITILLAVYFLGLGGFRLAKKVAPKADFQLITKSGLLTVIVWLVMAVVGHNFVEFYNYDIQAQFLAAPAVFVGGFIVALITEAVVDKSNKNRTMIVYIAPVAVGLTAYALLAPFNT